MRWPPAGVYLFFEPGEYREDDVTPRVVRVGTHALTETSTTTLWDRLRTHRGTVGGRHPGTGNHRASVFRLHVGTALIERDDWESAAATWGRSRSARGGNREAERELERVVSTYLGGMSALWFPVDDPYERKAIERGLIGLLSNFDRPAIDPPSPGWLGLHARHPRIHQSGLWNVNHVECESDPVVLSALPHESRDPTE